MVAILLLVLIKIVYDRRRSVTYRISSPFSSQLYRSSSFRKQVDLENGKQRRVFDEQLESESDEHDLFGINRGRYGESISYSGADSPYGSRSSSPAMPGRVPLTYTPTSSTALISHSMAEVNTYLPARESPQSYHSSMAGHLKHPRHESQSSNFRIPSQIFDFSRDSQTPSFRVPSQLIDSNQTSNFSSAHNSSVPSFETPRGSYGHSLRSSRSLDLLSVLELQEKPTFRVSAKIMGAQVRPTSTAKLPQNAKGPSTKLRPSMAELSGRINHTPVDMSMEVPPSPSSKQRNSSRNSSRNSPVNSRTSSPAPHAPWSKVYSRSAENLTLGASTPGPSRPYSENKSPLARPPLYNATQGRSSAPLHTELKIRSSTALSHNDLAITKPKPIHQHSSSSSSLPQGKSDTLNYLGPITAGASLVHSDFNPYAESKSLRGSIVNYSRPSTAGSEIPPVPAVRISAPRDATDTTSHNFETQNFTDDKLEEGGFSSDGESKSQFLTIYLGNSDMTI